MSGQAEGSQSTNVGSMQKVRLGAALPAMGADALGSKKTAQRRPSSRSTFSPTCRTTTAGESSCTSATDPFTVGSACSAARMALADKSTSSGSVCAPLYVNRKVPAHEWDHK